MANKLQLKIILRGSKPPIWRRVLIKDTITFNKLHHIIQDAMGWHNCHLYEFDLGDFRIGMPYEDSYAEIQDASKIKINKYLSMVGANLIYDYDFGDSWQHQITVEKTEPIVSEEKYPTCIKGKGNCPPEDCGGIWGYYELLEAIKNKKHPNHIDMLDWLGGGFDPNEFNIEEINTRLKKYY